MILGYHNQLEWHDLLSYDPGFATAEIHVALRIFEQRNPNIYEFTPALTPQRLRLRSGGWHRAWCGAARCALAPCDAPRAR